MATTTEVYNPSEEGVTLFAAFVLDILNHYEEKKEEVPELLGLAEGLDLSDPFNKVPMSSYNQMTAWIEENLGRFNLIRLGRKIGETAFQGMVANNFITDRATPQQAMEALVAVAANMIQDPEGRGWVLEEAQDKSILMRRTQTFNSPLQIGLLDGIIRKTGVSAPKVELEKSREEGAEFDEYRITWL